RVVMQSSSRQIPGPGKIQTLHYNTMFRLLHTHRITSIAPLALLALVLSSCNAGNSQQTATGKSTDSLGYIQLIDDSSLAGWRGDTSLWRVEDGVLIGEIKPGITLDHNSFI